MSLGFRGFGSQARSGGFVETLVQVGLGRGKPPA